jgi:hypothetical protein
LTPEEKKCLLLAFDPSVPEGEMVAAANKLINSLRGRYKGGYELVQELVTRLDHNKHPIRKRINKTPHWRQKIRITPESAVEFLLNSKALSAASGRPLNRPIWTEQVHEVAALIRKGKFPHDSDDKIVISHTKEWGYVIYNGQHRIAAIVLADKAVTTWVWSNAPLPIKEQFRRWDIANGETREDRGTKLA